MKHSTGHSRLKRRSVVADIAWTSGVGASARSVRGHPAVVRRLLRSLRWREIVVALAHKQRGQLPNNGKETTGGNSLPLPCLSYRSRKLNWRVADRDIIGSARASFSGETTPADAVGSSSPA